MIRMDKRFREAILDGSKTRTSRISKEVKWFIGEVRALIDEDGVYGLVRITEVSTEFLADICDADLIKEGFRYRSGYMAFMDEAYQYPNPKQEVWVIRFEVVNDG